MLYIKLPQSTQQTNHSPWHAVPPRFGCISSHCCYCGNWPWLKSSASHSVQKMTSFAHVSWTISLCTLSLTVEPSSATTGCCRSTGDVSAVLKISVVIDAVFVHFFPSLTPYKHFAISYAWMVVYTYKLAWPFHILQSGLRLRFFRHLDLYILAIGLKVLHL